MLMAQEPACGLPHLFGLHACLLLWSAHVHVCLSVAQRLDLAAVQVPGLAVVIVGERKDSQTYVRMKKKACEEVRQQRLGTGCLKAPPCTCVFL